MIKIKTPIKVLAWIKNFLSNRVFRIKQNDIVTKSFNIETGVPQGAVLSPILFSIFINDIPITSSKNKSYSLLFADDLVSIFLFKKKGRTQAIIQRYLSLIEKWLLNWRLMMAPNKCSHNTISNSSIDKSNEISLRLFNETIPVNSLPKFLGIIFDSKLNFNTHFKSVIKNCEKRLNIIKILSCKSWKLQPKTLINIYKSLIRSIMEYSSILYPLLSASTFKKLEIIQNKAIRFSFKGGWLDSTANLLNLAKIDDIKQRFDKLNQRYLNKCLSSDNELIIELMGDFRNFKSRPGSDKSILARYFEDIDSFIL